MEERRQFGFRVRPNQDGEPITLELPKRNASVYMASHFYLDDFPQSSEPLSDQPTPHTHVNPAEAFEADDEGYRGQPFPRPPRDMLRQRSFFSDSSSDFGGVDPVQALRMDGFDAPQPPTLGSRLRESGISAAETAIAGIGLGARQYAAGATIRGLGRGEQWLDRTLRIPRTPEGLAPPPNEVVPPQIIGRPSEVEPMLERAGQRAALQEVRAIRRSRGWEAPESWPLPTRQRWESPAQLARRQGALRWRGRPRRWWAPSGPLRGASTRRATDSDQSRSSGAVDIQTLNGMQESGVQQHFAMRQSQRQRPDEVIRIDSDSDSAPRAQAAGPRQAGRRGSSPRRPIQRQRGLQDQPPEPQRGLVRRAEE